MWLTLAVIMLTREDFVSMMKKKAEITDCFYFLYCTYISDHQFLFCFENIFLKTGEKKNVYSRGGGVGWGGRAGCRWVTTNTFILFVSPREDEHVFLIRIKYLHFLHAL